MGIFGPLFGAAELRERDLTVAEGFLGILLGAAACDGVVAEVERQAILALTERLRLFATLSPPRRTQMTTQLIDLLERDGAARFLLRCAAAIPDELRSCVFANACEIILLDGVVTVAEKRYLDSLQHELRLDPRWALTVVDVLIAKNTG
jgi:uncharacterized membrane protein YebE (DUF533 family)